MKAAKTTRILSIVLILIAGISSVSDVRADELGSAHFLGISAGFNDVFFGDYYGRNGDIEGHAAIKGNVDVQSYSFGAFQQEKHEGRTVLIVGGNVVASGASVYDGDAYIGGKMSPQQGQRMSNSLGAIGEVDEEKKAGLKTASWYDGTLGTVYVNDDSNFERPWNVPEFHKSFEEGEIEKLPFDFNLAENQLREASNKLWIMEPTVTAFDASGEIGKMHIGIDLTGTTGLQIVSLDASELHAAATLQITAGADTTLIINVKNATGLETIDLCQLIVNGNAGVFEGDFDGSNILFNVQGLDEITLAHEEVNASFLALDTHFYVTHGHISGQVFGKSAFTEGGGEFHAYSMFDDKHLDFENESSATTPEPATLLMLGLGAAAIPVLRRRKKSGI